MTKVQSETLREVAERIVRETILVVPGKIADRYIDAIEAALRNEREACAKAICNLCRRPEDYHPAKRGADKIWRHERIGHEAEWEEVCKATAIREGR